MARADGLQREGRIVALVAALCCALIGFVWVLDIVGMVSRDRGIDFWIIRRLPSVPYLIALAAIARAGLQVQRGAVFGDVIPHLLRLIGAMLALAAFLEMFGVPLILRMVFPQQWTSYAYYDAAYLAMGAVGLMLWLVGGMMRRAADMARELDEFF